MLAEPIGPGTLVNWGGGVWLGYSGRFKEGLAVDGQGARREFLSPGFRKPTGIADLVKARFEIFSGDLRLGTTGGNHDSRGMNDKAFVPALGVEEDHI
jgi:hypothetical protein